MVFRTFAILFIMEKEIGSQKWFEQTAISSIKKIDDDIWDFSNSSILYTPASSSAYENIQRNEHGYKKIVTGAEASFIEKVAPKIVDKLPQSFTYVDFGPGTEHKERFFQNAIKKQNKDILYVPVDISKQMLDVANTFAINAGFKTYPIHNTFENVVGILDGLNSDYRFISLGLTFINYEPDKILNILKKAADNNGSVFITAHIRERLDMETVRKTYESSVAKDMINGKLRLVGIDPETDIDNVEVTDEIKIYVTLKNTNPTLEKLGVDVGDKLFVLRSYRYSLDELKEILSGYGVDYYDDDTEFIACVIK